MTSLHPLKIVGQSEVVMWGHRPAERIAKQLTLSKSTAAPAHTLVARADALIDQPLLEALIASQNTAICADNDKAQLLAANVQTDLAEDATSGMLTGTLPPHIVVKSSTDMRANYWKALRKKETPYAIAVTPENQSAVEWRMFMGTYKGATDLVTKHVWPRPAFYVTRFLASLGVTPNMVTWVGLFCTILAFHQFWTGNFTIGLIAAWAMTFLDTVDGKLARTTLSYSKIGDYFDHGIDLIHPPFWYAAWGFAVLAMGLVTSVQLNWLLAIIIGGYIFQRLMEGVAIGYLGLEIHIWRKVDTFFRQITARRNPNLILLTLSVLINQSHWGLYAVAAWTLICLVLHGLQLAQGLLARRASGKPLESWMTQ